jgi:Ca2+-binding RTX toxin-like protein
MPAIQSIEVSPNPVTTGQNFMLSVAASPDVTAASAIVDFHPGDARFLRIPLTKQGALWTGFGTVPADLLLQLPGSAGALVRVAVFDAAHARVEGVLRVPVKVESITATFAGGILTVTGDDQDNTIIVSRDTAGTILVNSGLVPVTGGIPTVANTSLIRALGLGGNDVLTIDDVNGPMPPANLLGGDGDDTLTGSANDDILDGGPGNDTLLGRDGNDILMGGPGNDVLIGGRGEDTMFGGDGDDQIIWNPGDGSDVVEGEAGMDTLVFNGSNASETVDLSANGPRLRFFRNVANITMDCDGVEQVVFHALGGADMVNVNDLTGTQVSNVVVDLASSIGAGDGQTDTVIVNGTGTNDVIRVAGSSNGVTVSGLAAAVTVIGGEPGLDQLVINGLGGDDVIDASAVEAGAIGLTLIGGRGTDTLIGGAGDDIFVWNPGDGSDVIEGQAGQDTLLFNGANVSEKVDLSANGQRLRFTRDIANITMDCNSVESVRFNALGGADLITVNDLTGTSVTNVALDLSFPMGSGTGDNAADTVVVNATEGDDVVNISGSQAGVIVQGLPATVSIFGSEQALDQLIVRLLGGNDAAVASGLQDGAIKLTIDGGPGDDVIVGSAGADTLLGGEGDDVLNGGPGLDVLDGGPGSNVLIQD